MSGAEVLAVVGILANIAQVVDATVSVVKRVASFCNDVNELPKVLKQVQIRLPLLAVTLQKRSDQEVLNALSDPERKALESVLLHLQDRTENLQVLLNGVFPAEGASTWQKGWKAAKSFRQEKKAQDIVDEIEKYFLYLMLSDFQPAKPATDPLLLSAVKKEEGLQKPLFMVNIHQDGKLIGRESVMARLADGLSQENQHNRLAVVGLGGMGKTRIALEYALKYKHSNDTSVFWIHASSKARIVEAYDRIAKKANIVGYEGSKDKEKALELVKDWLESEASGKWLMVIDNADDVELLYGPDRLADYFPHSDNGSCIMTTRDKRVGLKFTGAFHLLLLDALDLDRSKDLLASKFSEGVDLNSCGELVKELEGIPLALVQAAAFIHMNSIDIDEYLEIYRQSSSSKIDLLSEDFEDSIRDREAMNPVAATWCISFEHIEHHAPLAGELLKRMCILDYQAIPISLLHSDGSQHSIVKALGTLQAFSLVHPRKSKGQEKLYDMHRLVHLSMRSWLAQLNQLSAWKARTLKILAAKYPNVLDDWEGIDSCMTYAPHALLMFASDEFTGINKDNVSAVFHKQKLINGHVNDENIICASCAATLLEHVAISCELLKQKRRGISWAMKALFLREFVYGKKDPATITTMYSVASALYNNGQDIEAREFGIRVVELSQSPEQPPGVVIIGIQTQAYICLEEDMLEEAEQLFKRAIQIFKDSYEPDHPQVLSAYTNLSGVYFRQERNQEAEQLVQNARKVYTTKLGPKHPATIICGINLAHSYIEEGRYDKSLDLFIELSEDQLNVFGPKSLIMAMHMLGILEIRWKEGKYDIVLELGLRLLEKCADSLGPEDSVTLRTMSILSFAYQKKGYQEEAERFCLKVLDSCSRVKVRKSPMVARKTKDVASLYENQGNFTKAEPFRRRVIEVEKNRLGENSLEVILSMCELGINYSYQGLHDKASEYRYGRLPLPCDYPKYRQRSFIRRMLSIADGWAINGSISDAVIWARDAVDIARCHREPTDIATISALEGLARICYQNYAFEEAEKLYREALTLRLPYQSVTMQDVARNLTGLARTLSGQVRLREAEFMALQGKEIILKIPHMEYAAVISNMSVLAGIYEGQGRFSEAERLYSDILARLIREWIPDETTPSGILDVLNPLERLAFLYQQSERDSKARDIMSTTLNIRKKLTNGPACVDMLLAISFMGDIYNSHSNYTESLALCLQYSNREFIPQECDDKRVRIARASIQHAIARSYIGLERYNDAEPFARLALDASKEILGEKNRFTLRCESIFSPIYMAKGLQTGARDLDFRMLNAWTKLLGETHPSTAEATRNLAKTYADLGKQNQAKELEEYASELRRDLDFGLDGEEEKAVDELVLAISRRWNEKDDMIIPELRSLSFE